MLGYVVKRLLWMPPMLLGITLATFVLLDLAPGDRAAMRLSPGADAASALDAQAHVAAVERLRIAYGQIDAETRQKLSLAERYGRWLRRALAFDFAGLGEDPAAFRTRVGQALPITLLLNALALLLALAGGIALGARERLGGDWLMLLGASVPQFLWATALVLLLGGGLWPALLPTGGLYSEGSATWPAAARFADMLLHLVLPVLALALGPFVVIARFVRQGVEKASRADFAVMLRGLGLPEREIRRRVLRHGLSPLVTLLGTMLPGLITGSVVVEHVFSLRGLGWLSMQAIQGRDLPMVMALTTIGAVATLIGLLVSDLLQRAVDPRVRLR